MLSIGCHYLNHLKIDVMKKEIDGKTHELVEGKNGCEGCEFRHIDCDFAGDECLRDRNLIWKEVRDDN